MVTAVLTHPVLLLLEEEMGTSTGQVIWGRHAYTLLVSIPCRQQLFPYMQILTVG
jgi:hypothetical protein